MPTPVALVPLAEHRGSDADRLRADVAAASSVRIPLVDEPLGSFTDGAWVWAPDGGPARAVVVRLGLGLPDIAPVRAEVANLLAPGERPDDADDPGVLASGALDTGSRWQLAAGRLVPSAPVGAVLGHLWPHTAGAGLGGCLVLFAHGADPRPELGDLVDALEELRTETVPRSARISLARGLRLTARFARASGVSLRRGRSPSNEELEHRVTHQLLVQLPPDAETRVLGLLRLDPVEPPHPWSETEVETILSRPVAELLAAPPPPAGRGRPDPVPPAVSRAAAPTSVTPRRTAAPPQRRRRDWRVPLLVGATAVVLVVVLISFALLLG
ncbi:hypothetical protein [Auraticoccus monumenti]|uniref:Uncharacterized protein n=1 Tax=Auraticoccus monumenti TaxID=675864 RepID=A0A1G6RYU0_9ACTN|nr:hypothetical protein [Auraticoccus monumenti]SDD09593.1 hypothetical protein SAMN04489747_0158 [Auraticoccus monumenti]